MLKDLITASDTVVFDLESDGLLDKLTKIHVVAIRGRDGVVALRDPTEALCHLLCYGCIVGHNIIDFDIPAIQKVTGNTLQGPRVIDTLVLSRLLYPTLRELDFARRTPGMPANLYGSHSLKAWGYRLGCFKGEFTGPWEEWSQEMHDYCIQDTLVTWKLLEHFASFEPSRQAVEIEMEFQRIICAMSRWGFPFDIAGAQKLNAELQTRKSALLEELQAQFPPIPAQCLGVYKNQEARARRILGVGPEVDLMQHRETLEAQGIKFRWSEEIPFNPGSEKQIADRFKAMGWSPREFTDKGAPKLDEPVLIELGNSFVEAKSLAEYALIEKRLGQISEGKHAWLREVRDDGRIHGRVNTMGAISFRCAHMNPNMGQVPAVRSPYGKECRSLFHVPEGWALVGCDVSGLELRILGHYMARWDNGEFIKNVTEGDVHTRNQTAAGLPTRDSAKTFIYALIYGAGDEKLGKIANPSTKDPNELRKAGKRLRSRFLKQTPALRHLAEAVRTKAAKDKKLIAVDGRILRVRSVHSALNLLIQSAGAIAVKQATNLFAAKMEEAGHRMEQDWCLAVHVHDEWQTMCPQEIATDVSKLAIQAIVDAGTALGIRCPLTGESKIGKNWAETH